MIFLTWPRVSTLSHMHTQTLYVCLVSIARSADKGRRESRALALGHSCDTSTPAQLLKPGEMAGCWDQHPTTSSSHVVPLALLSHWDGLQVSFLSCY